MATILFVSDKYADDVKIFMGSVAYLYQINCSQGGLPKLPVPEAWITFKGMDGDRDEIGLCMAARIGPYVCSRLRSWRPYNTRGTPFTLEPREKI